MSSVLWQYWEYLIKKHTGSVVVVIVVVAVVVAVVVVVVVVVVVAGPFLPRIMKSTSNRMATWEFSTPIKSDTVKLPSRADSMDSSTAAGEDQSCDLMI